MNRLFEIADELGRIAHERFDRRCELELANNHIAVRKLALVPPGGWPGKNADERKAAEEKCLYEDTVLADLEFERHNIQVEIDAYEASRETLKAEWDAITWTIRDAEQSALSGESILNQLVTRAAASKLE